MLLQALGEVLFTLSDARLAESSGLVAASSADAYFTVNDSNEDLRFFTVDAAGRTLAVTHLPGVDARDLEDAALGPGPSLYLADIGDNSATRRRVLVHRLPEPDVDTSGRGALGTAPRPESASLTYEDGPRDAETLLVHPRTGQVLVVTKGAFRAGVYAAPQPLGDGVLRRVGSLALEPTGTPGGPDIGGVAQVLVTGGAVSPDGRRVALRTYTDAYVYEVPGDDLIAALATTPVVVPLPETRQGEAVTWTRDGAALVTSSEGARAPVHRVPAPGASPGASPGARDPGPLGPAALPAQDGSGGPPLLPLAGGLLAVLLTGCVVRVTARRRRG